MKATVVDNSSCRGQKESPFVPFRPGNLTHLIVTDRIFLKQDNNESGSFYWSNCQESRVLKIDRILSVDTGAEWERKISITTKDYTNFNWSLFGACVWRGKNSKNPYLPVYESGSYSAVHPPQRNSIDTNHGKLAFRRDRTAPVRSKRLGRVNSRAHHGRADGMHPRRATVISGITSAVVPNCR